MAVLHCCGAGSSPGDDATVLACVGEGPSVQAGMGWSASAELRPYGAGGA